MGAGLIGWLAKGPLKLRVSRKHERQMVHQLSQIADWWRSLGEDAEVEYPLRVGECPIPIAQSLVEDETCFFLLMEWLTQPDDDKQSTPKRLIAARLNELLIWPPDDASTAWTQDPDDATQVIVFAGEMSWGDLPETPGFRQLQMLALTGVAAVVGIKLLDPCVTLTLTD
jgi:hypothetical protein